MWQSTEPGSEAHNLDYSFVDPGYVEALGIEMAAGRSFSREYRTDSSAVMLSEAAALDFGWTPDEAVGKQITQGARDLTVVGVMEPFHYRSLHAEIYPLALFMPQRSIRYSAIRISPENQVATLTALRSTWERFSDLPFAFSFLADNLAAQYAAEQRMSRIFTLFSPRSPLKGAQRRSESARYWAQQPGASSRSCRVTSPALCCSLSSSLRRLRGMPWTAGSTTSPIASRYRGRRSP
jgi:hypothetical protein